MTEETLELLQIRRLAAAEWLARRLDLQLQKRTVPMPFKLQADRITACHSERHRDGVDRSAGRAGDRCDPPIGP